MWSRKRIDIRWSDLWFAQRACWSRDDRDAARDAAELAWSDRGDTLACLSVRSGLDLLLTELRLPPGSEVLMSAVTIRDMARIVEEHGLVPVPVDLVPSTMAVSLDALERAITPRTRAIIVAHLFGAIHDLSEVVARCRPHGILVIEDGAQAFDGHRWHGDPQADVLMLSFGPIKTATALAGGLLVVRDPELLARMRTTQSGWPHQSQHEFAKRVRTYSMLKLISGRLAFSCLIGACRLLGRDYDKMLNGAVRNFPVDGFFASLRRQPCAALLRLLARRIATFDERRQDRRAELGRVVVRAVHGSDKPTDTRIPSSGASRHVWWVLPICVDEAAPIITALRSSGFDATTGSQLQPIPPPSHLPDSTPLMATDVVRTMMFLPLYPEMTDSAAVEMGRIVRETLATSGSGRSSS